MKFKIHSGNESDDYFFIESDDIDDIQRQAREGTDKRGWKDPWSEEVK